MASVSAVIALATSRVVTPNNLHPARGQSTGGLLATPPPPSPQPTTEPASLAESSVIGSNPRPSKAARRRVTPISGGRFIPSSSRPAVSARRPDLIFLVGHWAAPVWKQSRPLSFSCARWGACMKVGVVFCLFWFVGCCFSSLCDPVGKWFSSSSFFLSSK